MNLNNLNLIFGDIDRVADRLAMLDSINSFLFEEVEIEINGEKEKRKRDILTAGEKICVNQERRCLREYRDYLLGNLDEKFVRPYVVPITIEKKLGECLELMSQLEWSKNLDEIEVNNPQNL